MQTSLEAVFVISCSNHSEQLSEQPTMVKKPIILTLTKYQILNRSDIARQKCCNVGTLSEQPGREETKQ